MNSKLNKKMFRIAEGVSLMSDYPRIQIGAVIARKNTILAVGVNQLKSHPLQKKFNKKRFNVEDTCQHSIHAEMDALTKVHRQEDLAKATIYIFRRNNEGILAVSRPCPACLSMIRSTNIKKMYYTIENGFAVESFS